MRVAVVTPYYTEPLEILRQCHESVAAQTHPCTHVMVADGHPRAEIGSWPVEHITLPRAHGDNGNTPRCIGSVSAAAQGFEAIAYLDADNWYYPDHIAAMVEQHRRSGAAVCSTGRSVHRLDGSLMFHDRYDSDGKRLIDTSCLFLTSAAFHLIPVWAAMPKEAAPLCDQVFWRVAQRRGLSHAHLDATTVAFRTQYDFHYRHCGEEPPAEAKRFKEIADRFEAWRSGLPPAQREDWFRLVASGRWWAGGAPTS